MQGNTPGFLAGTRQISGSLQTTTTHEYREQSSREAIQVLVKL